MSLQRNSKRKVNRVELGILLGVSVNTISNWVEKGCPCLERGSLNKEYRFDIAAVVDWRIQRAVESAVETTVDKSAGGDGLPSKDESDRRKAHSGAVLAEIAVDTALGKVMLVQEGEDAMTDFSQSVRRGASNTINKISSRALSMSSASEIAEYGHECWNREFDEAKAVLDRKWSGKRSGAADVAI